MIVCALFSAETVAGADSAKLAFDISSESAERALKEFAKQARREILFPTQSLREAKTNPIQGSFTVREGLDKLLAGTDLIAIEDAKTGGIVVQVKSRSLPSESGHTRRSAVQEPLGRTSGRTTVLTGTVKNAATGQNLEGVMVILSGSSRQTFTNSMGAYRFDDVVVGSASVTFVYTGLKNAEIPVEITPTSVNRVDAAMTSDIYTLNKFVVAGDREGSAQAITLQRLSNGVRSIVSADSFGSIPNPAELLARLPGVEGVPDDGDTRYVRIRGMNQNLSSITMDGNRLADAASGGTTREFQFQQINSDAVERIEVVKSPTPDMDGDSIGGNVNMISKSAFDSSPERRIRGSFGTMLRPTDPRETRVPLNYSLAYSEVFSGKIGVTLNAAYRVHTTPQETLSQQHQQLPNGTAGPAYTYQVGYDYNTNERARSGIGLKVDYKLSDSVRFYVNAGLNKIVEHATGGRPTWSTGQTIATRDASGNLTGTGGIIPGFTDSRTDIRAVQNSVLNISSSNHYKDGKTTTVQTGAVHRYQTIELDYDLYESYSKTAYSGQKTLSFIERNIGFSIDATANGYFPTVKQTAGPDWAQIGSYTENLYSISRPAGWDKYRGATLNLKKRFSAPVPAYLKTGWRFREQIRRNESKPWSGTYVGPDAVMGVNPATGLNDDNLAQFGLAGPGAFGQNFSRYPGLPYPAFEPGGSAKVDEALLKTPQYFRQNIAANVQTDLTSNTNFKESIGAYYLMGNIELGGLSILGGFRVEATKVEGTGALQAISPAEKDLRAAYVGTPTDAELLRRTLTEFGGRQTRSGEYRDILPGLHFKYSLSSRLVTRLSYSTNIGRPGIGQLIPRTNVNYDAKTVSSSNPSLKPQTANNFDFSTEYYFEPAGVVSVGVFLKELKRFIYSAGGATIGTGTDNGFDGQFAGYNFTTQYNGGFAKVKGIEFSYSQQFAFLPGFWRGFGAFANLTVMKAEGNYGNGSAIELAPTPKIAGFNPVTANLGISYILNKVTVRIQGSHRGRYLSTYNLNESRLVYSLKRTSVDLKTNYRISKRFDVYMDVNNVFAEPDRGSDVGGRPGSKQLLDPQFMFGVNARL